MNKWWNVPKTVTHAYPEFTPGWWRQKAAYHEAHAAVLAAMGQDERANKLRDQVTACRNNALFADPDLRGALGK